MIQTQLILMRRELWEHRALYITPIVIAVVVSVMSLTGNLSIGGIEHIDMVMVFVSNMAENTREAALNGIMIALSSMFIFAMGILTIFYALDALYAERKDRSILFWRSMPLTDFETVLSKLLTAILLVPLLTYAFIILTHIIVLIIISVWVGIRGGDIWHLIWSVAPFFDNWLATLVFLLALQIWMSPFIGWFLFVSAFSKRSPLLIASLPLVMLPLFEKMLFNSTVFVDAIFVRSIKMPLFDGLDNMELLFQEGEGFELTEDVSLSLLSIMDIGKYFTSAGFWSGIIVCALFTTAAIYVRRYRDDS